MSGWRKRQVIELAERASPSKQDWWKDDEDLERFAELVRNEEREACAKLAEKLTWADNMGAASAIRAREQA